MDHRQPEDVGIGSAFSRQRKPRVDPLCCPICGVTLRSNEIDRHFALEVERLDRILKPRKNPSNVGFRVPTEGAVTIPGPSGSSFGLATGSGSSIDKLTNGQHNTDESTTSINPDECWGTYQKIKNNRQARLKLKSRKRKTEDNICPVCNKAVSEEILVHVEACLRKPEMSKCGNNALNPRAENSDDDATIDVEGETSDSLSGTGSSMAFPNPSAVGVTRTRGTEDTDDELNVEVDDKIIYGPSQYSELNVVYPSAESQIKDSYLRNYLLMVPEQPVTSRPEVENPGEGPSWVSTPQVPQNIAGICTEARNIENAKQIIESLKAKIGEYEGYIQNRSKCLICMDDYKNPVVSICCWHVYCEECWLSTLGAKKICPQCSMITSPGDLRRIYL
ncbi:E3 ubiquitin-protein ligase RNF220 [Toxorhynchites rutilus septentrionalis]|uniref:E3 ubiquitin-protein ligase RNF220 n=1 Tax=Toxorhynchites rutilus septentrionalis TaxID=329112 RepID=UPI00247B2A9E|nr:E3 ubiquitin-protein ligase RNF220 [Toxorhynchites rutilus septentrionalis]